MQSRSYYTARLLVDVFAVSMLLILGPFSFIYIAVAEGVFAEPMFLAIHKIACVGPRLALCPISCCFTNFFMIDCSLTCIIAFDLLTLAIYLHRFLHQGTIMSLCRFFHQRHIHPHISHQISIHTFLVRFVCPLCMHLCRYLHSETHYEPQDRLVGSWQNEDLCKSQVWDLQVLGKLYRT